MGVRLAYRAERGNELIMTMNEVQRVETFSILSA